MKQRRRNECFVARVQLRELNANEHDVQWRQNSHQNGMAEPRRRAGCAVVILDLNDCDDRLGMCKCSLVGWGSGREQ